MLDISHLDDHISYIKIPYKDIFVAIYVIRTDDGTVLFDTGAGAADVDDHILPMLKQLELTPTHIFISHNHRDHAWGLKRATEAFPHALTLSRSKVLQKEYSNCRSFEDGEVFLNCLQAVTIPGHTRDSAALLDTRTGTLISGDCLQSYGIMGSGAWYGVVPLVAEHMQALEKLRNLPIRLIATAHDYVPDGLHGTNVTARLDNCRDALLRLLRIIQEHPGLGDEELAQLAGGGTLPNVSPTLVETLRCAMKEGRF